MTPRGLAAALLISLGACGIAAGPAAAGGTLTPVDARLVAGVQHLAGPSFAGSGLAWATPASPGRGYTVSVASEGRVTSEHVDAQGGDPNRYAEDVYEAFAASPEAVAFAINVSRCHDESSCKYHMYQPVESSTFAGRIGQPLDFRQCAGPPGTDQSVDLDGTVIAYVCGEAIVRDISASGDESSRAFPARTRARIAGRYLAVDSIPAGEYDDTKATIAVYDWRTGELVYKLDPAPGALRFDIEEDGTLAFERVIEDAAGNRTHELDWASPEQPVAHRITQTLGPSDVRISGTRVAMTQLRGFRVVDLDGTELGGTSVPDAVGSFDFDGRRVAFGAQPCQVMAIATWDLSGAAPSLPAGRCPRALVARRVARADLRRRTLLVPIRCPATPALGCSGDWFPELDPRRSSSYAQWVALAPGETRSIRFSLFRSQACVLSRRGTGTAKMHLGASYTRRRHARGSVESVRIKTVGRARDCRR